ncbi:unnamed protein product [Caenorhabditis bovis]|uniref:Oxysterol-binding protein n=1 Tax=Caenorhabditis bovis TaxID=2654633 RepID=A0A8S1EPJ9_9PELO|nr:unnamed protein product [Caenorhabditis bovis]
MESTIRGGDKRVWQTTNQQFVSPHITRSTTAAAAAAATTSARRKRTSSRSSLMGTLRGRLRKARKQITWCAFPLNRRQRAHSLDSIPESDDVYSSAIDIPYSSSYGYLQKNPSEVGQTCRGSVNLQEARILSDKTTNSIVISAASQTFHVRALNDADRQKWVSTLEYARHKAIRRAESEEDEEAQICAADVSRVDEIAISAKKVESKLNDLKRAARMLYEQGDELLKAVTAEGHLDRELLEKRADLIKITSSAILQAAEEFVELSENGTKRISKIAEVEHKEKLRLQEQLETLAKQHSSLERAATYRGAGEPATPLSAYSDQEDEFHDAAEELFECNTNVSSSMTTSTEPRPNGGGNASSSSSSSSSATSSSATALEKVSKGRVRRSAVPERPNLPINLWSIMKNCIGKELSKIPMPVNFSEPLSVLQRITEDLEYAHLLEKAATLPSLEQMCYVAAYAASNYSTTCHRVNKPFNPLLGETYECDRTEDLGWKSVAEQVSHHPPAAAHHADGKGWVMYQDFTMTSRFRGKYLSVIPVGYTHVHFPGTPNHYSYQKITTTVHNIIVGTLWIDNHGDMVITNHGTKEKCVLRFIPHSYFSRETPRKVYGIVQNAQGVPVFVVQGTWDKYIDMYRVANWNGNTEKPKVDVDEASVKRIWTVTPLPKGAEKMHNFTKLAIELNEMEDGIAPTDSRFRPDQRLMEIGDWDAANQKKIEIEDKQRAVRRRREAEMEAAMRRGEHYEEYQPKWFVKVQDETNGALIHHYKGGYWEAKKKQDWTGCPDIF